MHQELQQHRQHRVEIEDVRQRALLGQSLQRLGAESKQGWLQSFRPTEFQTSLCSFPPLWVCLLIRTSFILERGTLAVVLIQETRTRCCPNTLPSPYL